MRNCRSIYNFPPPRTAGRRKRIARWRWTGLLAIVASLRLAALPAFPPAAGPPGGSVRSVIADPLHAGRFYLGTVTGLIYRSDDHGSHWRFLSRVAAYRHGVVARLAADPRHAGRLWAAVWNLNGPGGGIYRSLDDGRSWQLMLDHHAFHALAVAPSNSHLIVAGALDGVFASQDDGLHWRRISPKFNRALINIESLAIAPNDPRVIYAGTYHLLWETFNGGHDWWQLRRGIITDSDIFAIAINPLQPRQMLISACSGIFESDNGGLLFRKIQGIPFSARRTRALVLDPNHPGRIYAGTTQGFWETDNDGATWRRTTSPDLIVNAIALDPRRPGRLLLGTDFAGVWASNHDGTQFHPVNRGFSARSLAATAYDARRRIFYAAVNGNLRWGGVFASPDEGQTWTALRRGWPGDASVYRLLMQNRTLLAATDHGLWSYGWDGGRWRRITPLPGTQITDAAAAGGYLYAATPRGLWASPDQGRNWQLRREAPIPAYHVAAGRDGRVFVAGHHYVVASTTYGRQFVTTALHVNGRVNQIVTHSGHVYVATSDGLYFSLDRGAHWALAGHGLPQQPVYSVLAHGERITAIAGNPDLVFISRNAGLSWTPRPVRGDEVLFTHVGGLSVFPWLQAASAAPALAARAWYPPAQPASGPRRHQ